MTRALVAFGLMILIAAGGAYALTSIDRDKGDSLKPETAKVLAITPEAALAPSQFSEEAPKFNAQPPTVRDLPDVYFPTNPPRPASAP